MPEPGALGPRMGLRSWLFVLDLVALGPVVAVDLSGGRVGEPWREGWGDVGAEEEAERCCIAGVVDARLSVGEEEGRFRLVVPRSGPWLPLTSSALPASLLGRRTEDGMDWD